MTIRIITGDCREVLRSMASESVHMVCTSPPYYGLRDYGTAQWAGGDAGCDHKPNRREERLFYSSVPNVKTCTSWTNRDGTTYGQTCGKCGARRVDRQIGLEATPDEYLATMVAVFREVRRVLRDDGVCFVNMGDSYASGGMSSNQSRQPSRALACDNGDTEPGGSPALGSVCSDLCDECRGSLSSHKAGRIALLEAALRRANEAEHQPSDDLLDVLASTTPQSSQQPQASHSLASSQDAECLLCGRSLADDALASARMVACNRDSGSNGSASRTQGMDVSGSASPSYTTASRWRSGEYVGDGGKAPQGVRNRNGVSAPGAKPKDLLMMPARLALALQADGWWIRSEIVWAKPNPMPESVTDRPTSAHEKVYLLTKRATYFYDADAVREEPTGRTDPMGFARDHPPGTYGHTNGYELDAMKGRNLRNVWTIATAPLSSAFVGGSYRIASQDCAVHDRQADLAHVLECDARQGVYAFGRNPGMRSRPAELPEGAVVSIPVNRSWLPSDVSSATGRSTQSHRTPALSEQDVIFGDISGGHTGCMVFLDHCFATCARTPASNTSLDASADAPLSCQPARNPDRIVGIATFEPRPDGCSCYYAGTVHQRQDHFASFPPALAERCIKAGCPPWGTVLDPFAGAGTTMLVADRLQRHAIGIELNEAYAAMSRARLTADAPLLVEVAD